MFFINIFINEDVEAALAERYIDTEVYVNLSNSSAGILLFNWKGEVTKQFVYNNERYRVYGEAVINHQTMFRIGTQNQWIPSQYSKGNQFIEKFVNDYKKSLEGPRLYRVDKDNPKIEIIDYVPGYSIVAWDDPFVRSAKIINVKKQLRHGIPVLTYGWEQSNDGYMSYMIDTNRKWISSRYTDHPVVSDWNLF